jgi:hypothetical protein
MLIGHLATPTDDLVPPFFRIIDADPGQRLSRGNVRGRQSNNVLVLADCWFQLGSVYFAAFLRRPPYGFMRQA